VGETTAVVRYGGLEINSKEFAHFPPGYGKYFRNRKLHSALVVERRK
jgi:hypothetical protein